MIIVMQNDEQHKKAARALFHKYYAMPLYKALKLAGKSEDEIAVAIKELYKRKVKHYSRGSESDLFKPGDFDQNERLTFIGHGSKKRYGGPNAMEADDTDSDENGLSPGHLANLLVRDLKIIGYMREFNIRSIELIGCNIGITDDKGKSYVTKFNKLLDEELGKELDNSQLTENRLKISAFTNLGRPLFYMGVSHVSSKDKQSKKEDYFIVEGYETKEDKREISRLRKALKDARKQGVGKEELKELQKELKIEEQKRCLYIRDNVNENFKLDPRVFFDNVDGQRFEWRRKSEFTITNENIINNTNNPDNSKDDPSNDPPGEKPNNDNNMGMQDNLDQSQSTETSNTDNQSKTNSTDNKRTEQKDNNSTYPTGQSFTKNPWNCPFIGIVVKENPSYKPDNQTSITNNSQPKNTNTDIKNNEHDSSPPSLNSFRKE